MRISAANWAFGLAIAFALQLAPPGAGAADYFVSASLGNDTWSGTLPAPSPAGDDGPKRSTAAATQLLESVARPGDRVLFRRGDLWTGTAPALDLSRAAGTAGAPIVVGAYGVGALPRFDFNSSSGRPILQLRPGTSHLRFDSLDLMTSSPPGSRPYGVAVQSDAQGQPVVHHLVFSGMVVEGLQYGFSMYANQTTIENCVVRNNFKVPAAGESGHSQGIWFGHADEALLLGNRIENNGKADSWFDHNIYLSAGRGHVLDGNFITGVDGLKLRKTKDTVVRRNTFKALNLAAISLGGDIEGGASNIVIEQNVFEDTIDGVTLEPQSTTGDQDPGIDNVVVRNNVFKNPRVQGTNWLGRKGYLSFNLDYKIQNVAIYGNIFYGMQNRSGGLPRAAIYVQNVNVDPINVTIKGNIFHRYVPDATLVWVEKASVFQNLALDNNLYHCASCSLVAIGGTQYTSLPAFRAQYPTEEQNGLAGDPMLAGPPDDIHLTSASTLAIDRGVDVPGVLDVDFEGRQRPQGTTSDIGPYEFSGGSPPPPMAPILLPQ